MLYGGCVEPLKELSVLLDSCLNLLFRRKIEGKISTRLTSFVTLGSNNLRISLKSFARGCNKNEAKTVFGLRKSIRNIPLPR
jgi:hypothetical protein